MYNFKAMLKAFRLSHYRFTLIPESTIHMPAFNKGSILRGAFGSSLRRLVCSMDKGVSCARASQKEQRQ
ncbi:MAG: hypothetical protein AB1478_05415 [Nitrospirota bacterium]